jgi:lysozyme family protein
VSSSFYDVAFDRTIGFEGKFSDLPADRGGITKFGLSQKANPDLDIRNLTLEQAKDIYRKRYWDPLKPERIKSEIVQLEVFDTAVNCGLHTAQLIVQRALNFLGETLEEDGDMGSITVGALNRWIEKDPQALFKCLNGFQFIHYVEIVKSHADQKLFSRGWMKRIQEYNEERKS